MGWRSLTKTPAAGRPVLTTPKGLTARAGRADGTHGALDAPQPLPKLPARLAPCWAQTPQEGVALVHPLPGLKPRSLWGVSLRSTQSTDCPPSTSLLSAF